MDELADVRIELAFARRTNIMLVQAFEFILSGDLASITNELHNGKINGIDVGNATTGDCKRIAQELMHVAAICRDALLGCQQFAGDTEYQKAREARTLPGSGTAKPPFPESIK